MEKDARERLHGIVSEGAREILRVSEEQHADLVVMGVRGRNLVDLALFGSTTQHVVRGATVPVLVVHPT